MVQTAPPGYQVLVPGTTVAISPWNGVPPQVAVQHLVTLLRCRAYRDPSCERQLEALYRGGYFALPQDLQRNTDYASRYADVLTRFLGNNRTAEDNLVDGATVAWLYERIMPVTGDGMRYLPWAGHTGLHALRRAHGPGVLLVVRARRQHGPVGQLPHSGPGLNALKRTRRCGGTSSRTVAGVCGTRLAGCWSITTGTMCP